MLHSALGFNYAATAPHRAATLAASQILMAGGTAIEAMVSAAATIAVVYPHMNSIGGDSFWLIHRTGQKPVAISACGPSAARADLEFFLSHGYRTTLPSRGPLAALTVPGSISGWDTALALIPQNARRPLSEILASAIGHARNGFPVTPSQARYTREKCAELADIPGFAEVFLTGSEPLQAGGRLQQKRLASTLERLAEAGLDDFYRGDIAQCHARFLEQTGSPLRIDDFTDYSATLVTPIELRLKSGTVYNLPPPTQGAASLMILGLLDRLPVTSADSFHHIHAVVESTKRAFNIRNACLADPDYMTEPVEAWLEPPFLDQLASNIDMATALPWPQRSLPGDTIWMGCADRFGTVVSFIQSIYWEFGSGLLCPETGVLFQNRGAGFSMLPGPNQLAPRKRPFHTLNPALAHLHDGRVMAYGTMGGDGQPQTQAAIFSRHVDFGIPLQEAISRPRWLLGRTWGDQSMSLKLENRFSPEVVTALAAAGHQIEIIDEFSDLAGHAGAIVLHPSGLREGAADPRSDGTALAL